MYSSSSTVVTVEVRGGDSSTCCKSGTIKEAAVGYACTNPLSYVQSSTNISSIRKSERLQVVANHQPDTVCAYK